MATNSLQTLLTGIIDYAGLFPPAKLPLDTAIRDYARYRAEAEAWMLGRFICPAARLAEVTPYHDELFTSGPPFAFSALGRGGPTSEEFLNGLKADLDAVAAFRVRHGDRVTVDVLETKLTADAVSLKGGVAVLNSGLLQSTADLLRARHLTPFFEATLAGRWRATIGNLVMALADRNVMEHFGPRPAGFKLRCGGLEASAFPPSEQIAFTIRACRDAKVALKCTAGLHHPVRHFAAEVQTKMHGFLNVFGATVLAHARGLKEDSIRAIIEDEDPACFQFDDDGMAWKDLRANVEEIAVARKLFAISFGSCSFDEPRGDLRKLNLI